MSVSRRRGPAPVRLLILPSHLRFPLLALLLRLLTPHRILLVLCAPPVPTVLVSQGQLRRSLLILPLTLIQMAVSVRKSTSGIVNVTCVSTVGTPATW